MILIADSGSTKTEWYLHSDNGNTQALYSEGYNPYFVTTPYIINSLREKFQDDTLNEQVSRVFFYGSGCFPDKAPVITNALAEVFYKAEVFAELDLLAAARALLGNQKGFAAILGTGTNSCVYDGQRIIQNIDSLGFILGDEGSGTHIGKAILSEYLREFMHQNLRDEFSKEFNLTKADVFHRIYDQPFPNRFCSQFTGFARKHISHPYMSTLVENSFRALFTNLITHYDNYKQYSFNCIGSVGVVFKEQLEKVAEEFGMAPGVIAQSPMEGLIRYHTLINSSGDGK